MVLNNNSYFRFLILIVMSISLLIPYTVLAQDYTNLKKNTRVAIFSVQDQVNHNRFGRLDRVILETLTTELVKSNDFTFLLLMPKSGDLNLKPRSSSSRLWTSIKTSRPISIERL